MKGSTYLKIVTLKWFEIIIKWNKCQFIEKGVYSKLMILALTTSLGYLKKLSIHSICSVSKLRKRSRFLAVIILLKVLCFFTVIEGYLIESNTWFDIIQLPQKIINIKYH